MDLTFGDMIDYGNLQAEVEFSTGTSARLELRDAESSDIEVPRSPGSTPSPRTIPARGGAGRIEIHVQNDGYYDVYATLVLYRAECDDSFALSLFRNLLTVLNHPEASYEFTIIRGAEISSHVAGIPNRPMFYNYKGGCSLDADQEAI